MPLCHASWGGGRLSTTGRGMARRNQGHRPERWPHGLARVRVRFTTMSIELPVHTLRADVIAMLAASFIGSLGVAALALYALRRRSADVTPLAFAAFALMYAVRLAVATRTMQA